MLRIIQVLVVTISCYRATTGQKIREDLISDIVNDEYNKLVVPVPMGKPLDVKLDVILSELVDVNSQSQYVKTKLWLHLTWVDRRLRWDPKMYANIRSTHVPSDSIWLPDVVLYNNADGNYEVSLSPMAKVFYNGTITWNPPAIYSSSCILAVEMFPFDVQECKMHFKSWTYDEHFVNLINSKNRATFDDHFTENGEWSISKITAEKVLSHDSHGGALEYVLYMKRKPLFYLAFIVMPCILLAFLNVATFYLPTASGEKMTLCISVLLALTVFLFLISKVVAPTSLAIPMIGKFITLTMSLVTVSVLGSVLVININFRNPSSHTMPFWFQVVVMEFLPRLLDIRRPTNHRKHKGYVTELMEFFDDSETKYGIHLSEVSGSCYMPKMAEGGDELNAEYQAAINSIQLLTNVLKTTEDFNLVNEDWNFAALVIDNLFLILYFIVTFLGTVFIFFV